MILWSVADKPVDTARLPKLVVGGVLDKIRPVWNLAMVVFLVCLREIAEFEKKLIAILGAPVEWHTGGRQRSPSDIHGRIYGRTR